MPREKKIGILYVVLYFNVNIFTNLRVVDIREKWGLRKPIVKRDAMLERNIHSKKSLVKLPQSGTLWAYSFTNMENVLLVQHNLCLVSYTYCASVHWLDKHSLGSWARFRQVYVFTFEFGLLLIVQYYTLYSNSIMHMNITSYIVEKRLTKTFHMVFFIVWMYVIILFQHRKGS